MLANPEIGGFEVDVSFNEPESKLRRRLASFFDGRSRDDLLLVHFSCHGVKDDDGILYFATSDTVLQPPRRHCSAVRLCQPTHAPQHVASDCAISRLLLQRGFSRGVRSRAGAEIMISPSGSMAAAKSSSPPRIRWSIPMKGITWRGRVSRRSSQSRCGGARNRRGRQRSRPSGVGGRALRLRLRPRPSDTEPDSDQMDGTAPGDLHVARNPRPAPAQLPGELSTNRKSLCRPTRRSSSRSLRASRADVTARVSCCAALALERIVDDDSKRVSEAAASALADLKAEHEVAEPEAAELAAREQAERERVEREKAAREAQEQAEPEAAELAAREQAERERVEREKAAREAQEQAEPEAAELAAREQAERERVEREKAAREAQEQAEPEAGELVVRFGRLGLTDRCSWAVRFSCSSAS